MNDLEEILEAVVTATKSLAAQFTTVWVPIQLALILLAAIVGLLAPVRDALDSASLVVGGLRITALLVLKTTALLLLALWAASVASNFLDTRVRSFTDLTPSIQVLLGKLIRIGLITFAVLI